MKDVIAFVLGNFTLTFFVLGLIASAIALWRARRRAPLRSSSRRCSRISCCSRSGFRTSTISSFTSSSARWRRGFIGWADSPFQLEVGFASLGFAVVGLLAFKGSRDMRHRGHRRADLLSLGRGRRSHLSDDHGGQFRPGQRRHHVLQRSSWFRSSGLLFLWLQRRAGDRSDEAA